jgi:hypothetical protein
LLFDKSKIFEKTKGFLKSECFKNRRFLTCVEANAGQSPIGLKGLKSSACQKTFGFLKAKGRNKKRNFYKNRRFLN